MNLDTIIDQASIYIGYDATNHWLYVDWKGEHTQASSQASCMLLLESLRAWPCAKILNDNSNITRTTATLTPWGTWWLEEMMRAGLAYIAWIYPRNFEARQLMDAAMQRIERPVVVSFDDVASVCVAATADSTHSAEPRSCAARGVGRLAQGSWWRLPA